MVKARHGEPKKSGERRDGDLLLGVSRFLLAKKKKNHPLVKVGHSTPQVSFAPEVVRCGPFFLF